MFDDAVCDVENTRFLITVYYSLHQAFFAFRLDGGCAIGEGFLDERNDVGLGLVLVALGIFCCLRLLPRDGIGEEIVRSSAIAVSLRPISFQESSTTFNSGSAGLTAASFFIASWAWAGNANASRTIARNDILFISFSTIGFPNQSFSFLFRLR
jgi:hypothetical protein